MSTHAHTLQFEELSTTEAEVRKPGAKSQDPWHHYSVVLYSDQSPELNTVMLTHLLVVSLAFLVHFYLSPILGWSFEALAAAVSSALWSWNFVIIPDHVNITYMHAML